MLGGQLGGQLGDGTKTNRSFPVDVSGLGSGVTAVAAGYGHTCAADGRRRGQVLGVQLAGQLGDGTTGQSQRPVDVTGLGSGVTAVTTGEAHTCALTDGSTAAGSSAGGKLSRPVGGRHNDGALTPMDVNGLTSGVIAVAAGGWHTCAVMTAAAPNAGGNARPVGRRHNASDPAVDVSGLGSGAIAVAAGSSHTCALTTDGGVKCWGYNGYGQLGDGTTTEHPTPVDVIGLASGVSAVAARREPHLCADGWRRRQVLGTQHRPASWGTARPPTAHARWT